MHPKRITKLLILLVFVTSCTNIEVTSTLPSEVSAGTATHSEVTVTLASPTPSFQPAIDLITGIDDGTISVVITNGSGGVENHIDLLIQNKSDTAVQIKSQPGLLLADDNELTTDLVLPAISEVLIPPSSEINISVPAFEVHFRDYVKVKYPMARNVSQDYEVKVEDFLNLTPLPESSLSVAGIDSRLGAVLEAGANISPPVSDLATQMAIFAVSSDVSAKWFGICGSRMYLAGTFQQVKGGISTVYWFDCLGDKLSSDSKSEVSSIPDEEIYTAREILRKFAESNPEFAIPFRIVIKQSSLAFSNDMIRSAMVALVDQERLIERFGFGVTFHLMSNGNIPDDLAAGLPEITDGGMSKSEALAFLNEWTASNGPLNFVWFFEEGDVAFQMVDIVMTDWYEIDVIPEFYVQENIQFPGVYISDYLDGNFKDIALEHRPGLLPK